MSNYDISHSLPSWLDNRAAGVLLHPSSLPGCQGIGSLGSEARRFVDFLESSGFCYWQTCPVGPTGFGDSPYQVFCSSAGNPYFIDWSPLVELGLLQSSVLFGLQNLSTEHVEYGYLYNEFYPVARTAFSTSEPSNSKLALTPMILAPASAKPIAIALPIPLLHPVTIAVFPSKLNEFKIPMLYFLLLTIH
mgnify:CR=1 FL=1